MANIFIAITVDWEGETLNGVSNLIHLRKYINNTLPFTHFICPAYFVENNKNINTKIKSAIYENDEIGLHLHCYKKLITQIPNVVYKTAHDFATQNSNFFWRMLTPKWNEGRGVPISVYNDAEILNIINYSADLLKDKLNIKDLLGFRAGGWFANDNVLDSLIKANFLYDSSAVAPEILSEGFSISSQGNKLDNYGDDNGIFTENIIKLWGHQMQTQDFLINQQSLEARNNQAITIFSQPYFYKNLLEIPNNAGLSDFVTMSKTLFPLIEHALQYIEKKPDTDFYIITGCHQEGDMQQKETLAVFLKYLQKTNNESIRFVTMSQIYKLITRQLT